MTDKHRRIQDRKPDGEKPEILFDAEGFIRNPTAWDRTLGATLAAREGIASLTESHWRVLEALRKHYFEIGGVPVMRHICRDAGLQEHCVSELLEDPRRAWRIAGLPNPGEEARRYLQRPPHARRDMWDTNETTSRH